MAPCEESGCVSFDLQAIKHDTPEIRAQGRARAAEPSVNRWMPVAAAPAARPSQRISFLFKISHPSI